MSVGFRGHMAYVVAYMRSILGSIPFLVKLYTFFLCCGIFFWLPAPHPLPFPPVYFMLTILSSVRREVFATLLFTSIVYIFLCFPAFPCQETAQDCRTTGCYKITFFMLLHEKFLQFDWLRAVVIQLNLKYLHVKITNLSWVVV